MSNKMYARCMGGKFCIHAPGECTASEEYQLHIRAEKEMVKESPSDEIMMYCVFSMEAVKAMNGNRGKLGVMAGHAYLHSYWDAEQRFPSYYGGLGGDQVAAPDLYRHSMLAKKVCLRVDTTEELSVLGEFYKHFCGVSLVKDAGLTVFNEPTVVCLGIGPILKSQIQPMLANLKVLI